MSFGRILTVWPRALSAEVAADVVGDDVVTEIPVGDATDFDEFGGQLQHEPTGDVFDYVEVGEDEDTITLSAPLPTGKTFTEQDTLYVWPRANDLYAEVALNDVDEDTIRARIAQGLRTDIPEGVREPGLGEAVILEDNGEEWVITDLAGSEPEVDGAYIAPGSIPAENLPQPRDGLAPSESPVPTVIGGIGALFVKVDGVENNDPVTYEYHLSTTTGFTPDANSLATETNGTMVSLRALPDGTALAVGTDYYVVIIAKDLDGSAAASTEASGQLGQVTDPDIAADAVRANHILAAQINAEHLDVIELTATRIYSPGQTGWRVEIGDAEKPIQYHNGTDAGFFLDHDPVTNKANVAVSGRVTFGKSLLENDWAEFAAQSPGFLTPELRQKGGTNHTDTTLSLSAWWPNPTVQGNLLLVSVVAEAASGVTPPTITPPSVSYVQVATSTRGAMRLSLYMIENAAVRSGSETWTVNVSSYGAIHTHEYANIATVSALDQTAIANGNSDTISSGTTATTTQAGELWFAVGAINNKGDVVGAGDPTGSFVNVAAFVGFQSENDGPREATGQSAARAAVTTGAAGTTWPMDGIGVATRDWVGLIATFKTIESDGDPAAPATTACRVYAKQRDSGYVELHTIDETGRQTRPGSGWNLLDQGLVPATGLNFTNIPDWYQDLKVLIRGFTTGDTGTTARDIRVAFNGDTATGNYVYFNCRQHSDGSADTLGSSDAGDRMSLGTLGRSTSNAEITVFGYSRPTGITVSEAHGGFHSATLKGVVQAFGRWNSEAAVTSMLVTMNADFGVGSLYELYGVGTKVT